MTTYRLPDQLGGGECVVMSGMAHVIPGTEGMADVKLDGMEGYAMIPYRWLVEVEEPLPPEPPVGVVVRINDDVYQRSPLDESWYCVRAYGASTWADLCARAKLGTPVRLVPDPAVGVGLPWSPASHDIDGDSANSVQATEDGEVADRFRYSAGWHGVYFTPTGARAKAAALLAAADAAENREQES